MRPRSCMSVESSDSSISLREIAYRLHADLACEQPRASLSHSADEFYVV